MSADLTPNREANYFQTPSDPEGFNVELAPIIFRKIDYSALEWETLQRSLMEYLRTYYPNEFNDFVASNGFMMMTELMAYVGSIMSHRSDVLVNEAFFPTCFTQDAAINHLNLIGQSIRRPTPATVQIMCTVDQSSATDIRIPTNGETYFSAPGPDGSPVIYEVYSAPYDWVSDIIIPSRKYGVVAWGIEGSFQGPVTFISPGGSDQEILLDDDNILSDPIIITVDNSPWTKVDFLENYDSNDKVFIVNFTEDGVVIKFGDDVNGEAPLAGQNINIRYRTGGGSRGRISSGAIDMNKGFSPEPPATASVSVRFTNVSPSSGGYDGETLDEAKKRAPKTWATHDFIATAQDYQTAATSFAHPIYGGVLKAVATVFTQLNANVIKLSVLADGVGRKPVKPSLGLKNGLSEFLGQTNVLTDSVDVIDGRIKPVDFEANVVIYRNSDAASVKEQVESLVDRFFSVDRWEMGQPLYVSQLYDRIMNINGIRYVDIFKPKDDVLPLQKVGIAKLTDGYFCEARTKLLEYLDRNSTTYGDIEYTEFDNSVFSLTCSSTSCDDLINQLIFDFARDAYTDVGESPVYISPVDCCDQYIFGTYENAVDYDELITLGSKNINYYYESS